MTFWDHIRLRYRQIFAIEEIEHSSILQWFFGAMLFFFFLTFSRFIGLGAAGTEIAERGAAVCWPYFQNCSSLFTLTDLPFGYSQSEFYMVLYAVMLYIVYLMWKKDWVHAHFLLTVLWLWKMFVIFVLSYIIAGPYDYYHVILTAILLFIPFKEYFLKLAFVFLYFMSVTTKFDSTWVVGSYFSAMKTGLPLFPDALTPFFSNLVIFSQVIGCWFLLSKRWVFQRAALIFFVSFHLYSGILVHYTYPSIALPPLLILFGPLYRHTPTPFSKKALWGWLVILIIAAFQVLGFIVPGDRRMSLEANRFGMFMFEANHQCIADVRTHMRTPTAASSTTESFSCSGFYCLTRTSIYPDAGGMVQQERYESASAWNRCDPYEWWSRLHKACAKNPEVSRIAMRFDHSINGGAFYRIVDVPNVCDLAYKPFVRNEWIQLPPEAPIVGYPVQNFYSF